MRLPTVWWSLYKQEGGSERERESERARESESELVIGGEHVTEGVCDREGVGSIALQVPPTIRAPLT